MSYMENSADHTAFVHTGKVLLIYTGGTIGMGCNPRTKALEPLDFRYLVENMPEFLLHWLCSCKLSLATK